MSLLAPATPVPSLIPGGGLLPIPPPSPLQNVSQPPAMVIDIYSHIYSFKKKYFEFQLNLPLVNQISAGLETSSLSSQPPLMGNVDPSKVDEIRRTVYVGNLNSQVYTIGETSHHCLTGSNRIH